MRKLFLALVVCRASSAQADCLSYSGQVTVSGILSEHTYAEQPNYESIARGDAAATYYFVSPHRPFCMTEGIDHDGLEPADAKVTRVQLVFGEDAASSYAALRSQLSHEVACTGSLYHSMSGHHHSPILLLHATCRAAQEDIEPAETGSKRTAH